MIYNKTYKIVYVDNGIVKEQLFGHVSRKVALLSYSIYYDFVISCERISNDDYDRRYKKIKTPQFGFKTVKDLEQSLEKEYKEK